MDLGLKLTVTLLPAPEAVKLIAELKPPEIAMVIVEWPELFRATVSDDGEALMVKPGAGLLAVTVRETVVVSVVLPEVPVTVIG